MSDRVLLLSWEYPPVIEGGLARHVGKLAEALVRQGTRVDVLTRATADAPAGVSTEERAGVTVHRVPEPGWPRDLDRFVAWVEQMNEDMLAAGMALAGEHGYGLVHGHDWLVARAAAALSDRLEIPYATTIHATEHGRHQGWVHEPPQSHIHAAERTMAQRADAVIVCSHYMRGHVADIFDIDENRVTVIPNGIDPRDLQPVDDLDSLRAQFARPEDQLVLLIGRLVYEKGFQLALDALPGVIERVSAARGGGGDGEGDGDRGGDGQGGGDRGSGVDRGSGSGQGSGGGQDGGGGGGAVRFVVAGSGTHEAELRDQARRLGLDGHGVFLGWIGDDALHSLYRIADLCVVPSIYEPFGIVALEAMASGCPCIVADTGGLREVVPGGERVGLRFNGGDAEHLGVMIERLLIDTELRDRLVTEASEHVLRFDWEDIAERTRTVYSELTRTARAGAEAMGSEAGAGEPAGNEPETEALEAREFEAGDADVKESARKEQEEVKRT